MSMAERKCKTVPHAADLSHSRDIWAIRCALARGGFGMKVLWFVGCILLWTLRILLLPVRAVLWFLSLVLDYAGSVICGITSALGTLFLLGIIFSRVMTGLSDAMFLEGIAIGILMAVIPRALLILGTGLLIGIQSLLREI
jgi:hypothetical protein